MGPTRLCKLSRHWFRLVSTRVQQDSVNCHNNCHNIVCYNGPTWPHKLSSTSVWHRHPVSSTPLWHHHTVSSTTLWHPHTVSSTTLWHHHPVSSPMVWHDHTVSPILFYFYVFSCFVPLSKLKLVSFYPPWVCGGLLEFTITYHPFTITYHHLLLTYSSPTTHSPSSIYRNHESL